MSTIELTEVQLHELEEWLEGEAEARLQCEVEGLEPRIVPWRGWHVKHEWVWKDVGPLVIRQTQLTLLGDLPGLRDIYINPTPLPTPVLIPKHTRSLTVTGDVGYPILV